MSPLSGICCRKLTEQSEEVQEVEEQGWCSAEERRLDDETVSIVQGIQDEGKPLPAGWRRFTEAELVAPVRKLECMILLGVHSMSAQCEHAPHTKVTNDRISSW